MLYFPELLNMAFTVTALTALLTVASGSLHATSGEHTATSSVTRCALTFEVVYPEEEGADPYPICFSHCPAKEEVWFDGVAYKHFCDLERYNVMIEVTFTNGEIQGCRMVPLLTVEELKARQEVMHEAIEGCLAIKVEGSFNSSIAELGPVPDKLSGFTRVGDSYYLVPPKAMSWQEGFNFCKHFQATPAIIESHDEQRLLQDMLTTDVWIGLNDVAVEGSFGTIDRSTSNYSNWAIGQPNNGNGKNEDCTMMVRSLGFAWIDANCDYERRVLCEWLVSPVLTEVVSTNTPTTTTKPPPTNTTTTTTTTTRAPRYSCPADTHMFQTTACLHVSGTSGDYSQGIKYCSSRGMALASIHSQDEQTFIEGLLTDSVWIGMDDRDLEGTFRWRDGTALDYNHFARGQPDPAIPSEDCVEIRKAFGYHWNDWLCHINLRFLCKMAVSVE